MIKFAKSTDPLPVPAAGDENRFDFIRRAAAQERKKTASDDDLRRRNRQAIDDDRLI